MLCISKSGFLLVLSLASGLTETAPKQSTGGAYTTLSSQQIPHGKINLWGVWMSSQGEGTPYKYLNLTRNFTPSHINESIECQTITKSSSIVVALQCCVLVKNKVWPLVGNQDPRYKLCSYAG